MVKIKLKNALHGEKNSFVSIFKYFLADILKCELVYQTPEL